MAYPGEAVLRELYVERRMSTRACAAELGVDATTVRHWLVRANIPTRSIAEAKRGQKPAPHTVEASVRSRRKHALPGRPTVGYKLRADGYVDIWIPETQTYRREHRLIVEKALGRELSRAELVHHANNGRADNVLENLEVTSHPEHARHHYPERQIDPRTGRFLPGNPKTRKRKPRSG